MRAFGWTVLMLVFLDELLAMAGLAVWGAHTGDGVWAVVLAVVCALAGMTVWFLFASPKARYGGRVRRPIAKVVVFGLACLGLADAGHPVWALALLAFSIVVNGLAQLPGIRALATDVSRA
jgi:ABC-type amino acid transport system permease subunit